MAISTNQNILSLLKVWYKDGVQNLLFRNSPLLKKLNKIRVEGKQQNFCAMIGRGGAVSASFTKAKANAQNSAKNVEFSVVPGQLFSVYTMNTKEVQASLSKEGAYMRVAGNKMFAASEGLRKTLAAALYGRGYGEIAVLTGDPSTITSSGTDVTLPSDAIMKIDIGSELEIKDDIKSSSAKGTVTVTSIKGNVVKLTAGSPSISVVANDVLCIAGSTDSAGNPMLPVGLDGWLPTVENRTASEWTAHIGFPFFGVKRDICSDRLAGSFVLGDSREKYSETLQKLLVKCRRQGSQADLIVMNDEDFLEFSKEIEATNTFFTQTSTKEAKKASVGVAEFSASFSSNYIENIIDDPYCPKGKAYILDSTAVEIWSYTNAEKIDDGIAGNNPGKADIMNSDGDGKEHTPYALVIDDYLNVQSGSGSVDGPDTEVTLQFFGSFVVTNPSVCGVCVFKNATNYIGYTQ